MKTFIFGAGGHGKVALDALQSSDVHVDAFVDAFPKANAILGIPIFGEADLPTSDPFQIVVAIGANHVRSEVVAKIKRNHPSAKFINAVHASADVSKHAHLGWGCVVAAGAIVSVGTIIGDHAVINTGAQVDHDCRIGDFATIAPGAILGGNVRVAHGTYVAIGSTIIHGLTIGEWSVIGAGSVVLKDIPDHVLVHGLPAKVIRERSRSEPYL